MLSQTLLKTFAVVSLFAERLKYYHWNIEGNDFKQFHDLFESIYVDVYDSVDILAEMIRTLDVYIPANVNDLSSIKREDVGTDSLSMSLSAMGENAMVTYSLLESYEDAEKEGEVGISNFIQDRIQAHEKYKWFFRSITKDLPN